MIHILMPFKREEHIPKLIDFMSKYQLEWNPIVLRTEKTDFGLDWIKPHVIPLDENPEDFPIFNYKLNQFIEHADINDDDYYILMSDDGVLEYDVIPEIAIDERNPDVFIISAHRGHRVPKTENPLAMHPATDLIASKENMKVGCICAEQMIFRGSALRNALNENNYCGDGLLAERMVREGWNILYRPDLFALFNFYQEGRYNK